MRISTPLASAALAGALVLSGCDATAPADAPEPLAPAAQNGDVIAGRYIVVLKSAPGATSRAATARLVTEAQVEGAVVFENVLAGFAGEIGAAELAALRADERVAYIEPDRMMTLKRPGSGGGGGGTSQTTPYGIKRVNGGVASTGRVCVIDSGVDLDHPDLKVDKNASRTYITYGRDARSADDLNGHGTHVAGTIAALNNSQGVIGVAAGATVVAVKVLDQAGSGAYSAVIAGVDYVGSGAPGCTVANMSLGGSVSQALDDAVLAASKNVVFVLAAGNESDDAKNHSPARAGGVSATDNVYAISAVNSGDVFASFSNYGAGVEYAAPGVSIYSTYMGGGYATLSGTSMAAPHAAGVFLLGAARTSGTALNDPDGSPDPIIVH